jgi:hypothetical protein
VLDLGRIVTAGMMGLTLCAGCRDSSPPVPYTPPPARGYETGLREHEAPKPMPEGRTAMSDGPRPFNDEPLLVDTPPEARRFVEMYNKVGRPRITVIVDPTIGPSIDYGMMELLLTDWMAADGQVSIVSPTVSRARLTKDQVKAAEGGNADAVRDVADIMIHVTAGPTQQRQVRDVRILAEAMEVRGGDSLARAAVDMNPPMSKPKLNEYTRFLARKMMDGMATTWATPQPAPAGTQQPAPGTQGAVEPSGTTTQPRGGLGPRLDAPGPEPR